MGTIQHQINVNNFETIFLDPLEKYFYFYHIYDLNLRSVVYLSRDA